jgi:hypothetical protein
MEQWYGIQYIPIEIRNSTSLNIFKNIIIKLYSADNNWLCI